MDLERVKGNTWVLKSWELIPFYKLEEFFRLYLKG